MEIRTLILLEYHIVFAGYKNALADYCARQAASKQLSWDLSYVAVRNGTLSAYCLVALADSRSAVFDQISVSAAEQGGGVILLPYVFSMQRFFERGMENACYAMYGSNRHANAFRKKLFQIFPTNEQTVENYFYVK